MESLFRIMAITVKGLGFRVLFAVLGLLAYLLSPPDPPTKGLRLLVALSRGASWGSISILSRRENEPRGRSQIVEQCKPKAKTKC